MKKDVNLFLAYELEKKETKGKEETIAIRIFAAVLVLNLLLMAVFFGLNTVKAAKIEKLEEFFSDTAVRENIERHDLLKTEIVSKEHDVKVYQGMEDYVEGLDEFDADIYEIIEAVKPENVNILTFSYQGNTVNINCTTTNDMPPADYARALEDTGRFETVVYRGFNADETNRVLFPIVCQLKGSGHE